MCAAIGVGRYGPSCHGGERPDREQSTFVRRVEPYSPMIPLIMHRVATGRSTSSMQMTIETMPAAPLQLFENNAQRRLLRRAARRTVPRRGSREHFPANLIPCRSSALQSPSGRALGVHSAHVPIPCEAETRTFSAHSPWVPAPIDPFADWGRPLGRAVR